MNSRATRPDPAGNDPRSRERVAIPLLPIAGAALAAVLAFGPGCRRKEGSGTNASAPRSSTPVVEREEPPAIRSTAESGRPPFDGLSEPRDAAVDRLGRVWIADFGHSRLKIFDKDGGYLGGWGGRGNGTYGFRDPCGVAIREDDVYVADTWNGRVQHFTLSGEWKGSATGFFGPRGIAAGPDGRVWVTDTGNHQVRSYDAVLGAPRTFGKSGSGAGEFSSPVGIAVGSSGNVYIADTGNRRVVLLNADGSFAKSWPLEAWDRPVEPHIEIDSDGSLYVSDPGSSAAVLHLDPQGRVLQSLTSGGNADRFALPTGLAINRAERILYVVNRGNNIVSRVPLQTAGKQ